MAWPGAGRLAGADPAAVPRTPFPDRVPAEVRDGRLFAHVVGTCRERRVTGSIRFLDKRAVIAKNRRRRERRFPDEPTLQPCGSGSSLHPRTSPLFEWPTILDLAESAGALGNAVILFFVMRRECAR
jgi:hypothetical protein